MVNLSIGYSHAALIDGHAVLMSRHIPGGGGGGGGGG